ncbi:MAG: protein translocase subunit SecF [Oscillospiraceae bacterium]|nr:protein translocase subunit SecF [Oscillospiraceae bacterium]
MLKNYHFIKNKKITLIIVGVVVLVGILSMLIRGLNLGRDFTGGYELTMDMGQTVDDKTASDVENVLRTQFEKMIKDEKLENLFASKNVDDYVSSVAHSDSEITVKGSKNLEGEVQEAVKKAVVDVYPDALVVGLNNYSPTIGDMMMKNAIWAVVIAVALMLIYIAIRFEIASGLAAVICLLHDLFVMLTFYSLLQIPITSSVIAAFLTILGYSINATIVVFDRIRENRKKASEIPFGEVVNASAHETMGRSVNTTVTTVLTIGAIFVACFAAVILSPTSNLGTLRDFAGTLIIGILAGLFSSVFLSGMLWDALSFIGPKKGKKKAKRKA